MTRATWPNAGGWLYDLLVRDADHIGPGVPHLTARKWWVAGCLSFEMELIAEMRHETHPGTPLSVDVWEFRTRWLGQRRGELTRLYSVDACLDLPIFTDGGVPFYNLTSHATRGEAIVWFDQLRNLVPHRLR